MSNQFDVQEKEISELKKMIGQLTDTLKGTGAQRGNQGEGAALNSSHNQETSQVMEQKPHHLNVIKGLNTTADHSSVKGMLDVSLPIEGGTPFGNGLAGGNLNVSIDASHKPKRFRSNGIAKQSIALQNSKLGKNLETVDNTIPAGSFAQGVLLSGVDASTSTSASANPEPVLIELTDSGDLSRYFTSTVKGCRVTASSYGVLSKERVMMRLEKLSCIEVETGEVMTTEVDGYVSGEDGKLGLRGTVVDRAGDHVRAAMVGGFLSSFGNFLAASSNPVTFASQTGLAQITPLSGQELLKSGGAKGASGALDKYTEFYIKRAEQLEPVIQIGAGRIVQVVFNKTVGIGKTALKQVVSSKNDRARSQTLEQHRVDE